MYFSRDDKPLTSGFIFCEPLTQDAFRRPYAKAATILIGSINKVDAGCHPLIQDFKDHLFRRPRSKIHGAKAQLADPQR